MVADLRGAFERVVCISLSNRQDRWERFRDGLPSDWPFNPPMRFPAVEGTKCSVPASWKQGAGAWGCFQSHLAILRDCLRDDVQSVLILEDDAVCLPEFARKARRFWTQLPPDWQWVYLGGQHIELHLGTPQAVSADVYAPFNVNRTHAYGIRSKDRIRTVVSHLENHEQWDPTHHIDHRFGELHKQQPRGLYVPESWLIAQRGGISDVNDKHHGLRSFRDAVSIAKPIVDRKMVAVLGPFSGGTSAVAGVLHRLGVSMGTRFSETDGTNAAGSYEALELARFCRAMFAEPWLHAKIDRKTRIDLLKIWAGGHCDSQGTGRKVLGGKHPALCLVGQELEQAWNGPSFIAVDRSLEDVCNSLAKRGWGWPLDAVFSTSQHLTDQKELFLSNTNSPYLRINYGRLVESPLMVIEAIADFLNITPERQAIDEAVGFVKRREA